MFDLSSIVASIIHPATLVICVIYLPRAVIMLRVTDDASFSRRRYGEIV